ncbi:unnamed protein product [Rhizoctonia solani]|uniref:Uncharacterized protein n=1 Tax=Rhizoctonia solani TaxID=456999 RepID=A0A8H3HX62_9AGAM|nr:unnamed protein product [Rhizoctonia solani]
MAMEHNSAVNKHPRRLVVSFCHSVCTLFCPIFSLVDNAAKPDYLIQPNGGDRPQLVHRQDYIGRPSRFVRFATRLGLANGDKPVLDAVEKAHKFITSIYAPGDQVVLAVNTYAKWETDYDAKANDMLAWHLVRRSSELTSSSR